MVRQKIFIVIFLSSISLLGSEHKKAFCSSDHLPAFDLCIFRAPLHTRKIGVVPKATDSLATNCSSKKSMIHCLEVPLLFYAHSAYGVQQPLKSNRAQSCRTRKQNSFPVNKKQLHLK